MAIKVSNTTVIDDDRNITSVGIATVGSGSSTITLDGTLGNVNVGTGVTIEGISGNISIAGTINAAGFNVPTNVTAFSPGLGQTDVELGPFRLDLTFDQVVGIGTTGTVVLRQSSPGGTGIATFTVSSATRLSNYQIRIPSSTLLLPPDITIYPIVSPDYIVSTGGFAGINTGVGVAYSFTTQNFTFQSITPSNGATGIALTTNITLSFSSAPVRGTGTITLRTGSPTGTIVESFDAASSGRISVSGNDWILDPTSNISEGNTYYLVMPLNAILGFPGLNVAGGTSHSFTTVPPVLGQSYEGGYLICNSASVYWIVAPASTEVSRVWAFQGDANTLAQAASGCTGWFIPSIAQLQNPGFACRTYWDSYTAGTYWTNQGFPGSCSGTVNMVTGGSGVAPEGTVLNIRSFRTVTY